MYFKTRGENDAHLNGLCHSSKAEGPTYIPQLRQLLCQNKP